MNHLMRSAAAPAVPLTFWIGVAEPTPTELHQQASSEC